MGGTAATDAAAAATNRKGEKTLSPSELLISAAVSGVVTKTACAPLDRLRLLYQVQGMFSAEEAKATAASSSSPQPRSFKYKSLGSSLCTVVREEGLSGLWRGNGVNSMRAALCYAIKFPTNDVVKAALGISASSRGEARSCAGGDLSVGRLLLAGAAAGTLQKAICYPLDLLAVRVAMGVNAKPPSAEGAGSALRGRGLRRTRPSLLSTVRSVAHSEGLAGFYKGFGLTMVSGVPYVMLQMTFFDLAKRCGRLVEAKQTASAVPCQNGSPLSSGVFKAL